MYSRRHQPHRRRRRRRGERTRRAREWLGAATKRHQQVEAVPPQVQQVEAVPPPAQGPPCKVLFWCLVYPAATTAGTAPQCLPRSRRPQKLIIAAI